MALALINVIDKTQLGVKGHCRQRCLVAKWSGCSVTDRVRVRCRAREWFFFFWSVLPWSEGEGDEPRRVEPPPMSSSTAGLVCCVVLWFKQVRKSLMTPNSREIL